MQVGSKFKLNESYVEDEKDGLLKYFPDLNLDTTYQVLRVENIEETVGATQIKDLTTNAVYSINELNKVKDIQLLDYTWWCFICTDTSLDYEVVE